MTLDETEQKGEETPEMKTREAIAERITSMSPEDFNSTIKAAGLSEAESTAMKNMRDVEEWTQRIVRGGEIRNLYFAAKHPKLSRVFSQLGIGIVSGGGYDYSTEAEKFSKNEEGFTNYDWEQALEKLQKHLG